MPVENATFMNRWYTELWNNGNDAIIGQMIHPDCRAYGLGPEPVIGPEEFKKFYDVFRKADRDIHVTVEKNFVDGDYAISLCSVKGVHTDSDKPVSFTGTSIAHLKNGQITEGWNHFDFLTLNIQNGKIDPEQLR